MPSESDGHKTHVQIPKHPMQNLASILHVVYASDVIDCALVASMTSLSAHTAAPVHYHIVMPTTVQPEYRLGMTLPLNNKVDFHIMPTMTFDMRGKQPHIAQRRITWARLFLPEYVPSDTRRLLYLDTDTLVDRDVASLFSMPLNTGVGAVRQNTNFNSYLKSSIPGVPKSWKMFNSGVLLVNVGRWRAANITRQLLSVAESMRPFNDDQVLFNVYFARNEVTHLPSHWNHCNIGCSRPLQTHTPGIHHWSCKWKWWKPDGNYSTFALKILKPILNSLSVHCGLIRKTRCSSAFGAQDIHTTICRCYQVLREASVAHRSVTVSMPTSPLTQWVEFLMGRFGWFLCL